MADGDADSGGRSRRRREDDSSAGLSVADLLARHGADVSPRATNQRSLWVQPDIGDVDTAEFSVRRPLDDIFPDRPDLVRRAGDVLGADEAGITERLYSTGSISALNSPLTVLRNMFDPDNQPIPRFSSATNGAAPGSPGPGRPAPPLVGPSAADMSFGDRKSVV